MHPPKSISITEILKNKTLKIKTIYMHGFTQRGVIEFFFNFFFFYILQILALGFCFVTLLADGLAVTTGDAETFRRSSTSIRLTFLNLL